MSLSVEWTAPALDALASAWVAAAPEDRSLITDSINESERVVARADEASGVPLAGHPAESYAVRTVFPRVPEYRRERLRLLVVRSIFLIVWVSPADSHAVIYAAGRKRVQVDGT